MKNLRITILFLGDVILAYIGLFLTVLLGFWGNFNWTILQQHILPFTFLYFFWFIILYIFELYNLVLIKPKIEFITRLGESSLTCLVIGAVFFYLIPFFGITPKTNLLINTFIFTLLLYLWRRFFYYLFSSLYFQKVAFLGKTPLSLKLVKQIENNPQIGYKFFKFLDSRKPLLPQLKNKKINLLIITQELFSDKKISQELYKCLPFKIEFVDLPRAFEDLFHKIPIDSLNQFWFLKNLREGEKKVYDKIKRVEDIIISSLLIALTSPLWLIFAILIKREDKGPIFYKQKRVGKENKVFWLQKFRSMKVNAEKKGAVWAEKEDPRTTRIGRFLRKSHLDEISQMLNVLKGDISIVGPRPERPEFVKKLEKEIPHYHLRHIIKPGFTGWAQVKFGYARSVTDSHEKFQYDLYYIKNRSFFLDLDCLLRTFQLFFKNN